MQGSDILDVLPTDVLIDIFTLCLDTAEFPVPNPRTAPLLLGQISKPWKQFAESCPQLWRKLAVSYDPNQHKGHASPSIHTPEVVVRHLTQWKANSKNTLRSFSLKISQSLSTADEQFFDLLLSFLLDNSATLKCLELFLYSRRPRSSAQAIFPLPLQNLSALEDVRWRAPLNDLDGPADTYIRQTFRNLPPLRRFFVNHCTLAPSTVETITSWTHLTHLSLLRFQNDSTFYALIRHCKRLQYLSLIVGSGPACFPPTEPVIHDHLATLKIVFDRRANPSFFHNLSFPSLKHFRLCSDPQTSGPSFSFRHYTESKVFPFNQLTGLTSLILGYHDLSSDRLVAILHHTPLLVELRVDSELGSYNDFLLALTHRGPEGEDHDNVPRPEPPLIPQLEILDLYIQLFGTPVVLFENDVFWDMVESRVHGYPLQSVILHVQDNGDTRVNYHQLANEKQNRNTGPIEVEIKQDSDLTLWLVEGNDGVPY